MTVTIRRGNQRFTSKDPGRETRHAFSFGEHYDPSWTGVGPLVTHDEHLLRPGAGFAEHTHRDLVIVSWVVQGGLDHSHGDRCSSHLEPGALGLLVTGAETLHAEIAAHEAGVTRFVQSWLVPDEPGGPTHHVVAHPTLEPGRWVAAASGHLPHAVHIPVSSATLWIAHLGVGESISLPDDPLQHVFVARGALTRSSMAEPLQAGDAFVIDGDHDLPPLTAGAETELLAWTFTG